MIFFRAKFSIQKSNSLLGYTITVHTEHLKSRDILEVYIPAMVAKLLQKMDVSDEINFLNKSLSNYSITISEPSIDHLENGSADQFVAELKKIIADEEKMIARSKSSYVLYERPAVVCVDRAVINNP